VSVCVALDIQHAMRLRQLSVACQGLQYVFPRYLINGTIFEKHVYNKKYVFRFSLQRLSETLVILRRIERDMTKIVYWYSCKVPVIHVRF